LALFRCGVCGYIHDEEPPDKCQKCGAPKEKFKQLNEIVERLILKSRKTNEMHVVISGLLMRSTINGQINERDVNRDENVKVKIKNRGLEDTGKNR